MDVKALAAMIDQTLLKPTAGQTAASEWIESSIGHGFATLCVSPFIVPAAVKRAADTKTAVCSVAGFPLGYQTSESKAEEARHLVALGCAEIDMVVNIAQLIEGDLDFVRDDIEAVVNAVAVASDNNGVVKVILETGYLTEEQTAAGCRLVEQAGAHFVKTSTGFGPRGASVRDVEIMREQVGDRLGIKAAGGIRDLETAQQMIDAGATRIGTSSGIEIIETLMHRG